jgi:hypothetical protein
MEMLAQANSFGALFFTLLIALPSGRSCSTVSGRRAHPTTHLDPAG